MYGVTHSVAFQAIPNSRKSNKRLFAYAHPTKASLNIINLLISTISSHFWFSGSVVQYFLVTPSPFEKFGDSM